MKIEQLPLIDVTYNDKKATMTFLDKERGEIREVTFNKQSYDNAKSEFIDDPEKEGKVEEWCNEYFGLTFDTLSQAIGTKHDVYCYDKFNSLWETKQIAKFDKDMVGQIIQSEIKNVVDNGNNISIEFEYDNEVYASKMSYSKYDENERIWYVNPQQKKKQYEKFETKFHVPVTDAEQIIGHPIMVEIKAAFGKFVYAEIKPFPKKKK